MSPVGLFRIREFEVVSKDERPSYLSPEWDLPEESSAQRRAEETLNNPAFAGVLAGARILYIKGVGATVMHHACPMYRPRCHDVTALDHSTQIALADLVRLCAVGIASGIACQRPIHPTHPPEVYQWVLSDRKKWRSVQVERWNWNTNMKKVMVQHPNYFKSGMRPLMLWSTFRNL